MSHERVADRLYGIRPTRYDQVVFRLHGIAVIRGYRQLAASLQREVADRVERRVRIGVRIGITPAIGELVFSPLGQRDEAFVRLLDEDGRRIRVRDGSAVQDELHLRVLGRVHDHLAIIERS